MFKKLIVALLFPIIFGFVANAQDKCNTYSEPSIGITFCVPQKWIIKKEDKSYANVFGEPRNGFTPSINVQLASFDRPLSEYVDGATEYLVKTKVEGTVSEIKIKSRSEFAAEAKGLKIVFEVKADGLNIKTIQYYFKGLGNAVIIVTATLPLSDADGLEELVDSALKTFKVTTNPVSFAQAKSITSEDYYAALRKADSEKDKQIRKLVQVYKSYTDGKVVKTISDTFEYLPPDKSRWVHINEREGKIIERFEQISIGNTIYRKEADGAWVKREKQQEMSGPGGVPNIPTEFFIEETKIGKEKFQVLTRKTVNTNKTRFEEDRTWINKKGLIAKSISTDSINKPENIDSTFEMTYDYKIVPPKIEPPIK